MFAARGIDVVVGAEHHASLLGPLGASFLSLDIWVAEADGEEAAALLRDFREGDGGADLGGDAGGPFDGALVVDNDDDGDLTGGVAQARTDLVRRTVLALLLGCCVTFGTAHMSTRAWMRGIALAGLEILGLRYVFARDALGVFLIVAAVVYDVVGALWRVRTAPRATLPVARLRSPG